MISFALDEEQRMIQETVRKFAAEHLRPRLRDYEKAGALPESLRRQFHELGLDLLDAPEAVGGHGAPLTTTMLVQEELAFGDAGAAVALGGSGLAVQAVLALGDETQARRLLERFGASEGWKRSGALAWAERKAPLEGFGTLARKSGDGWVLDGTKAFVVNGGTAELLIVFAQVEGEGAGFGGVGAFAVEGGARGLSRGERHQLLGLETVEASELRFEECVVPPENRLSRAPDFVRATRSLLARAGLGNAARQVGLARASYDLALEYTQERKAFGKPVAHFQAIAFMLAEMLMDVESARWMVWRAAVELERGQPDPTWEAIAHANEAAWRVADQGVQLLGGAGYVKDFPVEKWLRDCKALALFAPPSEWAQMAVAGAELGAGDLLSQPLPSAAIQPFFT